jgi:hypothetical protein
MPPGPLGRIGRSTTYENWFKGVRDDVADGVPREIQLPWLKGKRGQHFWEYYLNTADLDRVRPHDCWRQLVPFRLPLDVKISMPSQPVDLRGFGFVFPHGVGVAVDAIGKYMAPLSRTVEAALELRRDPLIVSWSGEPARRVRLDDLGRDALDRLETMTVGSVSSTSVLRPFTVVTVIQAAESVAGATTADPSTEEALYAFATWSPTWRADTQAPLSSSLVPIQRTAPAGHIVYASKRGRVVWFPRHFKENGNDRHTLSCYHRNLSSLSLQVESLCGFMRVTANERIRTFKPISANHQERARNGSRTLGRLYSGKGSYQSQSVVAQMELNDFVEDTNVVRAFMNDDPLSR